MTTTGRGCSTGASGPTDFARGSWRNLRPMSPLRWPEFRRAAPDIAAVGRRLLYHPDRGEVAILATVDRRGAPRVAPVCPVFTRAGLYVLASAGTPKVIELQRDPRYALHAQVGADDLEFQIAGRSRLLTSAAERAEVLDAVPFDSFDPEDPIFELLIGSGIAVSWPAPDSPVRLRWAAR